MHAGLPCSHGFGTLLGVFSFITNPGYFEILVTQPICRSKLQVGGPHLYGPAGATLVKLTGSAGMATLFGVLGLLVWVVGPLVLSMKIFERQNL